MGSCKCGSRRLTLETSDVGPREIPSLSPPYISGRSCGVVSSCAVLPMLVDEKNLLLRPAVQENRDRWACS
jgi:hypothetical protein